MRTIVACAATLTALLVAAPAFAEVSQNSNWQLRQASTGSVLARLKAQPLSNGALVARTSAKPARPAVSVARSAILAAYEADIVRRMNAIRTDRGLRALRISRQLSAAAAYHTNQMGLRGFFEHESANGAEFWKRIERFYPSSRAGSWSVGENILWGSPEISASAAIREWMQSPPHRENILSGEWREVGLGATHFPSAPGAYHGGPVTIVTVDFGARS
ncbi:MAG: CAP domain-containing protein [Actinobacteria bacterium]|nr:CAP domain-containing protein [Actinomycetota bacterium]